MKSLIASKVVVEGKLTRTILRAGTVAGMATGSEAIFPLAPFLGKATHRSRSRLPPRDFPQISSAMTNGGLWLSLVERFVRDEEVVGSNPASPTILL